jgi:biotin transport system substrate-specific component
MLAGAVLGAKRGGLSMLLFIGLVALGLPLLAGGRGGLGVFVSPTAGFVVGFPVAAFVTGLVMQSLRIDAMVSSGIASLIGGIVVLYAMGIGGFWMLTDKGLMASITIMATYIPGDLVKVVLTAIVIGALVKARPQSLLSRQ